MPGGEHFDSQKDRWDLVSWPAIQNIVDTLTYGAEHKPRPDGGRGYGERNWEDGIKFSKIFGSLMRHLLKAWHGCMTDDESTVEHMGHAGCCWMFLTHYLLHIDKYKDIDDRPLEHNFRDTNRDWSDVHEEDGKRLTSEQRFREVCQELRALSDLVLSDPEAAAKHIRLKRKFGSAMEDALRYTLGDAEDTTKGIIGHVTTNKEPAPDDS